MWITIPENGPIWGRMGVQSSPFREYLAPDESVVSGAPGTIVDRSTRSRGSIGITDRRVLMVTDTDRFIDVSHDAISSIRSRPRTTVTATGIGYRLVAVGGAMIAVFGVVSVLAIETSGLAAGLALATVGGTAAAEYVRRTGVDVDWSALDAVWRAYRSDRDALVDELADVDLLQPAGAGSHDSDLLVLTLGVAALFALVGLVSLTERLLVVLPVLASIAGVGLTDHGHRRWRTLDRTGAGMRHERAVSIHLVDGRTVDFRVDATVRIDRTLSAVVREPVRGRAATELPGT